MYRLVKEHSSSFEVKHPDGSNFHVAKHGLDKGTVSKITSLKMAEGGTVPLPEIPKWTGYDVMNPSGPSSVGAVSKGIESVTGAPARASIGAAQEGKNPITAFGKQFGENPETAPTGEQLVEKSGVTNPTAKSIAGTAMDFAADPTNFIPGKAIAGGLAIGALKKATAGGKAARLARAEKMGFDTEKTFYHGTTKNIEAFDPSKTQMDNIGFGGNYVTPDLKYAHQYGDAWVEKDLSKLSKDPELNKKLSDISGMNISSDEKFKLKEKAMSEATKRQPDVMRGEGGNIMPLYLKKEGIIDLHDKPTKQLKDLAATHSIDLTDAPNNNYAILNRLRDKIGYGEPFTKFMKDSGITALKNEDGAVVVIDPANIRSIFAEFDPKKAKSSLLHESKGGVIPMDYTLHKEHANHFEIGHPDGSTFMIAKSGLKPEMMAKIQKMSTGGDVEDPSGVMTQDTVEGGPVQTPMAPSSEVQEVPEPPQGLAVQGSPAMPPAVGASEAQPPVGAIDQAVEHAQASGLIENPGKEISPAVTGSKVWGPKTEAKQNIPQQDSLAQYNQNIQKEEGAQRAIGAAESFGAKTQQQLLENHTKELAKFQETNAANELASKAEYDQRAKDVADHKFDANRIWHNMSNGSKAVTAVGILLSGIGSGLSGQPNLALKMLDDMTQRDMEAQKADLGKKESLLSENLKRYGNMKAAEHATYLQMAATLQGQIAASAAQTKSQTAGPAAQLAISEIENKAAPMRQQLARMQTLQSQMGKPGTPESNAAKVQLFVAPHEQAEAYKELQQMENMEHHKQALNNVFDQAEGLDSLGNRVINPLQSNKEINALVEPALAGLIRDSGGRINKETAEMIKPLFPAFNDNAKVLATKKRQLNEFIGRNQSFPRLIGAGIVPSQGLYNNAGQKQITEMPAKGR